ncbi:STAS domain-containing protein [Nonomuraea soli]|uniref:Anti-sigma factor antagonist n=1 Tax=Nonomuraea soli TaxID=1032476 RepID=A0A7W0HQH5_9ACTN|nr:STAS domain-containing protein [Nonomuraea soli]MBA2891656.1 anti-sigma B factor antagonist [Nonomuraea soli]
MVELVVEVERSGSAALVRIMGDLDKTTVPQLQRPLRDLITDGCTSLVIDTTELAFCDSSGLWLLLQTQQQIRQQGGAMRLDGVHGVLRRILEITGLSAAFPAEEAVPHNLRSRRLPPPV